MKSLVGPLVVVLATVGVAPQADAQAQHGPLRFANVAEPSAAGRAWRNGLDLSLREINARGGILGRQVVLSHVDGVDAARAARPFLMFAAPPLSAEADLPVLTPDRLIGEPAVDGGRLADYVAQSMKLRRVAVIAPTGVDAHESEGAAFRDGVLRQLAAHHVVVVADIASTPQQVDFSAAVLRAKTSRADALLALVGRAAAPHLLAELRRQGYDKPVLGGAALLNPAALRSGVPVHAAIGLSAAAPLPPLRDVARSYAHAYGESPEPPALAGYSALYIVKAVAERIGTADQEAFAQALVGMDLLAVETPGVLLDIRFDGHGHGKRATLLVESRDGRAELLATLPP